MGCAPPALQPWPPGTSSLELHFVSKKQLSRWLPVHEERASPGSAHGISATAVGHGTAAKGPKPQKRHSWPAPPALQPRPPNRSSADPQRESQKHISPSLSVHAQSSLPGRAHGLDGLVVVVVLLLLPLPVLFEHWRATTKDMALSCGVRGGGGGQSFVTCSTTYVMSGQSLM